MPNSVTIARAMSVARCRSFCAPVEISPSAISSAVRPPSSTDELVQQLGARHQVAILERQLHRVAERAEAARDDRDLVHRVEAGQRRWRRWRGPTRGRRRSRAPRSLITRFFSSPAIEPVDRLVEVAPSRPAVLSLARRQQRRLVDQVRQVGAGEAGRPRRDDLAGRRSGASLHALARGCAGSPRARARRACRPAPGGRSGRGGAAPGRAPRAGWWRAMMMTPLRESKPSISASSWLSVCSRSSWLPIGLCTRVLPSASSSSMKTMHGAFASACWNRSRTRAAPTPTNISTNSEPLRLKNGTLASPATARASSVLPVPGRADQQHALRDPPAEARVLLRVLQELDDLLQLVLGLVDAGHVREASP